MRVTLHTYQYIYTCNMLCFKLPKLVGTEQVGTGKSVLPCMENSLCVLCTDLVFFSDILENSSYAFFCEVCILFRSLHTF